MIDATVQYVHKTIEAATPFKANTDGDGIPDGRELSPWIGTNPLLYDTDGDGVGDGDEIARNQNVEVNTCGFAMKRHHDNRQKGRLDGMKCSWIGIFVMLSMMTVGCASAFVRLNTWNGPPSTEQKVHAAVFDVVTMPVQLPFWIVVGMGSGAERLSNGVKDHSWRIKRNRLYEKFRKDPGKMQEIFTPECTYNGLALGMVYADQSIPLSEEFLVAQVMQYFSSVRFMASANCDDELAALLYRKEWTANGLRAIAPQLYLGRTHYPAPDYVTLAYLSNPNTPIDVVAAFAKHPSFKYRKAENYCKVMRDEISTNVVARMEKPILGDGNAIEESDATTCRFLSFLRCLIGRRFDGEADWRVGGGTGDLCAVGTPHEPCSLMIDDVKVKVVELYGDKTFGAWDGTSRYLGDIGAVVIEFDSVAMRDRFLKAVLPVCRLCGPECWSQLVLAPTDGTGECYGICLEIEGKPNGSSSHVFIINLDSPFEIRFWPPRQYGSRHVWFANANL